MNINIVRFFIIATTFTTACTLELIDPMKPEASDVACQVNNVIEYTNQFLSGPNSCIVDSEEIFTRMYVDVNFTNPLTDTDNSFYPFNRPFVFASGDGGCVNNWLQSGVDNTHGQYNTVLDIGYSPLERCRDVSSAQTVTLLVWKKSKDDHAVWATWNNVIPYMANLYSVNMEDIVITSDLFYNTSYAEFKSNSKYEYDYKLAQGNDRCVSTRTLNSTFMYDAMTNDSTGVKFRAALEACFAFFDVFQGNGYSADLNQPDVVSTKCKEYLFPNHRFNTMNPNSIIALPLQIGTKYQEQEVC